MSKTATRDPGDGGPPYRLGVGLILINDQNETLACERFGYPGEWQWPQGGLDQGEDALATAYRELTEEVGLTPEDVTLVGKLPCETTYDFPDYIIAKHAANDAAGTGKPMKYRGQIHQWFVFRLTAPESAITLDQHHEVEFSAWQWLPAEEAVEKIVAFKRSAYQEAARCLRDLLNRRA